MGLRDRIVARHHQPCQPCGDMQPAFQQGCSPQPLILSTPYATMGTCSPPPTVMPECTIMPMPPVAELYKPDLFKYGGDGNRRGGGFADRSKDRDEPTNREKKTERELRAARDEIDNLKKQLEQLKENQRELLRRLPNPDLIPPAQPRRTSDSALPSVPFNPGNPGNPGIPGNPGRPWSGPPPFTPAEVRPQPGPASLQPKPWEPPLPAAVRPAAEIPKPVPLPVNPPKYEAPKPVPLQPKPIEGQPATPLKPEVQRPAPQPVKTVEQLVKENQEILEARVTGKVEVIKAGFDKYMKSEEVRLSRAASTKEAEHPSASYASTKWLLDQGAENLITDYQYAAKINDVGYKLTTNGVKSSENEIAKARTEQWEQIRSNAANPQDPNMETKQALLHQILIGNHITEGRQFGRANHDRGDSPLQNNKEQMQVEAAEALVKANATPGINHDLTTRLIADALANRYVPERARVALLASIVPMSNDDKNTFLDGKPKDTALAIVVRALDRSHASGKPEEAFQLAAINKLTELNDVRAIGIMEKLAAESPMRKVKELATQKLKELRAVAAK